MIRTFLTACLTSGVALGLCLSTESLVARELVPVTAVSSNGTNTFPSNPPSVLVTEAQGDYNYSHMPQHNPGGGGGGTSWHTYTSNGVPPIVLTFDFANSARVNELVLWDYYGHSPADWTVKLFAGSNGTGAELLSYDFAINTFYPNYNPSRWNIDLPRIEGANSATLSTRGNSYWGGVGMAEVAFVIPEPTTFTLVTFAIALCTMFRLRRT
jgi:hypothetical protein